MAYDLTDLVTTAQLKKLATRTNAELGETIRYVAVSGNTINFYNEKALEDPAQEAAFSVDFPSELFLDAAATQLVQNFAWSAASYPDTTDPNLDGKQVLVLGVKTQTGANATIAYSFVDLTSLIEIIEIASGDSEKVLSLTENGKTRTIGFNISTAAGNMLTVNADGLYATLRVSGAVQDNVVVFDVNGAPADSGIASADVLTKLASATADHIVTLNADGSIKDSGIMIATDAEIDEMIVDVFGAAV
ncbi:MAG: hypothetical protein IJ667_07110 [Synergistaceae bacterium]|nr:hypothetical protein [Synergistaceae bacterium]